MNGIDAEIGVIPEHGNFIHLNPFRAGIVADVAALKDYPFTGHSALMGKKDRPWQDTAYVLTLFGRTVSEAEAKPSKACFEVAGKGRCPELTGGGLVRSAGGWRGVKEAYRVGIRLAGDERILGSSEFIETTLKQAGEAYNLIRSLIKEVTDVEGGDPLLISFLETVALIIECAALMSMSTEKRKKKVRPFCLK